MHFWARDIKAKDTWAKDIWAKVFWTRDILAKELLNQVNYKSDVCAKKISAKKLFFAFLEKFDNNEKKIEKKYMAEMSLAETLFLQ